MEEIHDLCAGGGGGHAADLTGATYLHRAEIPEGNEREQSLAAINAVNTAQHFAFDHLQQLHSDVRHDLMKPRRACMRAAQKYSSVSSANPKQVVRIIARRVERGLSS